MDYVDQQIHALIAHLKELATEDEEGQYGVDLVATRDGLQKLVTDLTGMSEIELHEIVEEFIEKS